MSAATLEIGGLAFRLEGGDGVERAMHLPGMAAFVANGGGTMLTMTMDADCGMPADGRVLHTFAILENTAECRFEVDAEGVYRYVFSTGGVLRIDPRRDGHAECTAIGSPDVLRFAIWLAYGMMAARHGRLPIHASAVVHRGSAVLCLGESGTGKSTHTRLWLNNIPHCHLLNDDSPIVAVTTREVVAYGSPWSGKSHCYRAESHPVAAFLRLEQRPRNAIRRLPTLEAFGAVQPSLPPAMSHDEHLLDMQADIASGILSTTPVYRLGCRPDADAARLSHNTIYGNDND